MIYFSALLGCRSCLKSDGIRHIYTLIEGDANKYLAKTEFEVMTFLEKWRIDDDLRCEFCGSSNVEVLEIEVNDYLLYDYDRLIQRCERKGEDMFMVNIDKRDSEISFRTGGSRYIQPDILREAIHRIINTLYDLPEETFLERNKGNFFICLTGGYSLSLDKAYVQVETFRSAGLTREDIIDAIKPLIQHLKIDIDSLLRNKPNIDTPSITEKPTKSLLQSMAAWLRKK